MFVITIRTESAEGVDMIKEVLETATDEGEIKEPFELQLAEENDN